MTERVPSARLDEILLREGLITEEQLKEALTHQKEQGNKLGSQLLYHGHLDEAGLVRALTIQYGCEGVVLSNIEIPDAIARFIPTRIAAARKVMPFGYNPDDNILKIACENPTDESLIQEMSFVARGKQVRLYVAAELALINVIAKHYMDFDPAHASCPLLELPPVDESQLARKRKQATTTAKTTVISVLLVTDTVASAEHFRHLLPKDQYDLQLTESVTAADPMIEEQSYAWRAASSLSRDRGSATGCVSKK